MKTEPVGLSRDLPPKGVMRAQVKGADIAIWRSTSGVVSAWENRCPHRGMRLSHGFVRGESLACAYHGWHYNCSGKCDYIPAHPELEPPSKIKPVVYNVIEHAGILWVSICGAAKPAAIANNLSPVRSIVIQSALDTTLQAFSAAATDTQSAIQGRVNTVCTSPAIVSIDTNESTSTYCIAFQQPEAHMVVAHVLARHDLSANELIAVSRWCEQVRHMAEQPSLITSLTPKQASSSFVQQQ